MFVYVNKYIITFQYSNKNVQHVDVATQVSGSGSGRQTYIDETVKTHLSVLGALPACGTPRIKCTILLCACLRCANSDVRSLAMPCMQMRLE